MKKLLTVLALVLIASPVFANSINGSLHDVGVGTEDLCAYCHTPHNADTSVASAPLWNRGISNSVTPYTRSSMSATPSATPGGDVGLCLSCHDGTAMNSGIVNSPAGGLTNASAITTASALLTTDLTDDHPVGFTATADGGAIQGFIIGNLMQCSSCHNVHDNAVLPFLKSTNASSALCLTCHVK